MAAIHPLRADPTRSATLRRRACENISARFNRVKSAIIQLVFVDDAFGLKPSNRVDNELTVNVRWRFSTDSAKVRQFQQWFATQVQQEIIASSAAQLETAYYKKFVEDGYKKGAGRAFDDTRKASLHDQDSLRDFYAGSKDEFLRSSFAQPIAIDKIKQITGRVYTDLKGVDASMASRITRTLADGLAQGANPRTIARGMVKTLDMGKTRALTIARTEIIRAHAEGQLDAMDKMGVAQVGVMVEWSAAYDDRTCPLCADMDGVVLTLKEARGIIPRHPNAVFGPSTFVSYGECLEAVRAYYSGPCVILYASGGGEHRTTIGPNHPMMTARGMVRAKEIREGDKVLYDLRQDQGFTPGVYNKQIPTSQDVFETILSVCRDSLISSPSHDLHGDRVFCEGEVQAICPTRGLLPIRNPSGIEKLREDLLLWPDPNSKTVAGFRPGLLGCCTVLLPSTGGVGGSDSWVAADNHFVWLAVEKVELGNYYGLAFDYTTESSLYCSDGFVVSNCRCAFMPANVGEDTKKQKRTQKEVQGAIDKNIRQEIPQGRMIKGQGRRYKDPETGRFTKKTKRTLAEQKARSNWAGADVRIAKVRPKSILDKPTLPKPRVTKIQPAKLEPTKQ